MMNKFKGVIWRTFCEADERYLDLTRIAFVSALASAIVLEAYAVIFRSQHFSAQDFCIGLSAILAGGGAGIGIRGRLEDGKPSDKDEVKP